MKDLFLKYPLTKISIYNNFILILFSIVCVFSPARTYSADFSLKTTILDNGLEIAVVSDHRSPIVTQLVYYRAGSADESDENRGIAHMLEHMMFQGTSNYSGQEFRDSVERYGGIENAFTSADITGYWQTVGVEALEMIMRFEADRMENLIINQEAFNNEVEVVKEERIQRYESSPGGPFGEAVDAATYLAHPYRYPIIGYMHHIESFTIQQAQAWYEKWYIPSNAILILAGDITMEEILPLAKKYYGVIPSGAVPERERALEPPQLAERRVIYRDKRVSFPSLGRSYLTSSRAKRDGVAPALTVAAEILSSSTGLFYQELVVNQGIASSAGAYYSGNARDWGRFGIWIGSNGNSDVETMENAIDDLLNSVIKNGFSQEDVDRAKNSIISRQIFERDNVAQLARRVGAGLGVGLNKEEIVNWTNEISTVTLEDINTTLNQILDIRKSTTGLLLPAD